MYYIQVHETIDQMMRLLYRVGFWHRSKESLLSRAIQFMYLLLFLFYPISLFGGSMICENQDEAIFAAQAGILTIVCIVRLYYVVSDQKQIVEMINRMSVYSMEDFEKYTVTKDKTNRFMKLVVAYLSAIDITTVFATIVAPFLQRENKLLYNIAFPLDWKNNTIAYIIANAFIFFEIQLAIVAILFSIIIWYLLFNCALQYEELGDRLKNLGVCRSGRTPKTQRHSRVQHDLFLKELIFAIKSHQQLNKSTDELKSFITYNAMVQIFTSSLSICGSIYCLAFIVIDEIGFMVHLTILLYNIVDIYMIMHFGNEIKVSSDRLCYCLFESNWINQTESCKKYIIIFAEFMKNPKELVIAVIYRLTLETFTKILNSSYYFFNILKNLH